MQHVPLIKRLAFYRRETLHTPFGNCVLLPLGWALNSLLLMRSLHPLVLGVTNLSSLIHFRDLSMDWHYVTASALGLMGTISQESISVSCYHSHLLCSQSRMMGSSANLLCTTPSAGTISKPSRIRSLIYCGHAPQILHRPIEHQHGRL